MPNNFVSGPGGINIETGYLRETDILDRYIGNRLWSWGYNLYGQIGDNSGTNRSSPVQTISGGTNWTTIAAGGQSNHTVAIKSDGTLWSFGLNASGQLGDNSSTNRSSPVQTVSTGTDWKTAATGSSHTAALKTDGSLWLWGVNSNGQLGTSNQTGRSSPVQTVSTTKNWYKISTGGYHTAAIKTDGTLWIWGRNTNGQLGASNITHRSSPVQTTPGGTNWKEVSAGDGHTLAIKTDGSLWVWGYNTDGTLGDGTITHRSSPVQTVAGGTNWRKICSGYRHSASIKTDGTLWAWGLNANGQLGVNDIVHRSSPAQVISGGTNWKEISASFYTINGIKTDGTLWIWGQNTYGQVGDRTIVHRSSPVQTITGGDNWKKVIGTSLHTVAVTFKEG